MVAEPSLQPIVGRSGEHLHPRGGILPIAEGRTADLADVEGRDGQCQLPAESTTALRVSSGRASHRRRVAIVATSIERTADFVEHRWVMTARWPLRWMHREPWIRRRTRGTSSDPDGATENASPRARPNATPGGSGDRLPTRRCHAAAPTVHPDGPERPRATHVRHVRFSAGSAQYRNIGFPVTCRTFGR
jgi:hypothetical protein